MKKLSTYLFLFLFSFSAPSFADDISDFEIEGISIGDSALEYISLEEIQKEIKENKSHYEHLKNPYEFGEVYLINKEFQNYDLMSFFVKTDNEKYKISAIRGLIYYNDDIEGCINKKNEISNVLSNMFKDAKKKEENFNHSIDPSGNSKVYGTYFKLKSGEEVSVDCIDFEETLRNKMNWSEGITVGITTIEFDNWIRSKK